MSVHCKCVTGNKNKLFLMDRAFQQITGIDV